MICKYAEATNVHFIECKDSLGKADYLSNQVKFDRTGQNQEYALLSKFRITNLTEIELHQNADSKYVKNCNFYNFECKLNSVGIFHVILNKFKKPLYFISFLTYFH